MDEHVRDEVVKALRLAVRALRSAESALLRSPSAPPRLPSSSPETTLLNWLSECAAKAKAYEEQDPQSFRVCYEKYKSKLLEEISTGKMLVKTPDRLVRKSLEATDATKHFQQALKTILGMRLQPIEVLRSLMEQPSLKPWGNIDVTTDIVVFRSEGAGIDVTLDAETEQARLEEAKAVPGAIERVQQGLAQQNVEWKPGEAKLHVADANAKWCATLDCRNVMDAVAGCFIVVERTDVARPEWWAAATASTSVPEAIQSLVRAKKSKVLCPSTLAETIEKWAASLPGWYSNDGASPIILRNAAKEDLQA